MDYMESIREMGSNPLQVIFLVLVALLAFIAAWFIDKKRTFLKGEDKGYDEGYEDGCKSIPQNSDEQLALARENLRKLCHNKTSGSTLHNLLIGCNELLMHIQEELRFQKEQKNKTVRSSILTGRNFPLMGTLRLLHDTGKKLHAEEQERIREERAVPDPSRHRGNMQGRYINTALLPDPATQDIRVAGGYPVQRPAPVTQADRMHGGYPAQRPAPATQDGRVSGGYPAQRPAPATQDGRVSGGYPAQRPAPATQTDRMHGGYPAQCPAPATQDGRVSGGYPAQRPAPTTRDLHVVGGHTTQLPTSVTQASSDTENPWFAWQWRGNPSE
ncbi:hypothetical protein MK805_13715 [Shimazuella sp. AN120528]|uniref:hypothetical protein n=1 Tax=Shimazuella soli TaxID=1892854 RepID=UPI001F10807D|nr:hypothetical protein [Shimazuella soli]MCH5585999.1 hypothetical protein [Shimazuella soli]